MGLLAARQAEMAEALVSCPPCAGLRARGSSLGLVVEGGEDLVGVLVRVVKSQAGDREIDDFMTVPRSRPG
jgi:hypothetical protein